MDGTVGLYYAGKESVESGRRKAALWDLCYEGIDQGVLGIIAGRFDFLVRSYSVASGK